MKRIILLVSIFISLLLTSCSNNEPTNPSTTYYDSIKIGNQIWSGKNLNVEHYRNGDPIPEITSNSIWDTLTTGGWCYYNNDTIIGKIHGKLYNRFAINDPRGLAPVGWHIPSDSEWTILANSLGNSYNCGISLKSKKDSDWQCNCKKSCTNQSDFTGLASGFRDGIGGYGCLGEIGQWWTSTIVSNVENMTRGLSCTTNELYHSLGGVYGYSVRCVKDLK